LPTINHKPRWDLIGDGFQRDEPLFNDNQIEELATILGADRNRMIGPLEEASSSIRRYCYVDAAQATPGETTAALEAGAKAALSLHTMLVGLDPGAKSHVRREYSGDTAALDADIRSVLRLWQNLELARRRSQRGRGRRTNDGERHAASRLIRACEIITGTPFKSSAAKRHRAFVMAALGMLKITQQSAAGAIAAVLETRSDSTEEKLP
jgi:hypothetical protein